MGTRGLEIVRFRGRYYVRWHKYDGYFEGLGAQIVASIPSDPDEYQRWLQSTRSKYAAKECALERLYEIRDGSQPDDVWLPSELPRLNRYGAEYTYTIDLDREILTMNHSIHWQLGNIPRQDDMWLRAIRDSIYRYKPTISLDICSEDHMGSPALELPQPSQTIGYDFQVVIPKKDTAEMQKVFLTSVLAEVFITYKEEIVRYGMEWSPDSFPFRELAFALVFIASGRAKFHSFPAQICDPRSCIWQGCRSKHLSTSSPEWLGKEWAGYDAPLPTFGSLSHRPGNPSGASPAETIYWIEDVLVSLTLVVDGKAITDAVAWGIGQRRRTPFQVVVLSLFEVAFAEVSYHGDDDDEEPFLRISEPISLSPLRSRYCVSTHPRERPELKPGMKIQKERGELAMMMGNCTGTARRLQRWFPGLASLVSFFDAAASRRAASKHPGRLPMEVFCLILDLIDYETWKTCLVVSREFRSHCLTKYRLDDRMSIVAGPFVRRGYRKEQVLSFDFKDAQTGASFPAMRVSPASTDECNWMPVIGSDRKVLMLDTVVQFTPAGDVPVEADSDDKEDA